MEKQVRTHQCGGKGPWIAGRVARGVIIGLAFILVFGVLVRLLWNWLMPGVFGLSGITYGQAVGLIVLARIIFGARGMRPGFAGSWGGHGSWGWAGPCSSDVANGHIKDWRHYDAWWEEEGREAYKKYIDSHAK